MLLEEDLPLVQVISLPATITPLTHSLSLSLSLSLSRALSLSLSLSL
jgi:hypothetical protein